MNISRRDYFAASALQGLLSAGSSSPILCIKNAIRFADEMIKELDKKTEKENEIKYDRAPKPE